MNRRLGIDELKRINRSTIQAAGARYTPSVEAGAPNLQIQSLLASVDALGVTEEFRKRCSDIARDARASWEKAPREVLRLFRQRVSTPGHAAEILDEIARTTPEEVGGLVSRLYRDIEFIERKLNQRSSDLFRVEYEAEQHSKEEQKARSKRRLIDDFRSDLSSLVELRRSGDMNLVTNNRMFLLGEWGTGKTHFLCDIVKRREEDNLPSLFFLAQRLPTDRDPLSAICKVSGLARTPQSLLRKLNDIGERNKTRALIVVDGINESDRPYWRREISRLASALREYNHVGLLLSCRTPFDRQILEASTRSLFEQRTHVGFDEIEIDAQHEFFLFYDIPTPSVPLLTPEFSRPLFLKILCKTLSGKTSTHKKRSLNRIASGQKGMTKLLEDFVRSVGSEIERDFGLPGGFCWRLLKGGKPKAGTDTVGVAVSMADGIIDTIPIALCRDIITQMTGFRDVDQITALFNRLVNDGLLAEDVAYEDGGLVELVRMPYQRFSDHLIARHLLQALDVSSDATIRRAFYRNRPLGKVFNLSQRYQNTYDMPGLASAVMLEFPERVKRTPDTVDSELVFFLPKNRRLLAPLGDAFLDGLPWRDVGAFSKQTDSLVSRLLEGGSELGRNQVLEMLVTLGSRHNHPYSAMRLVKYLAKMDIPTRDLFWSEFLRTRWSDSAVLRVLNWVEKYPSSQRIEEDAAKNLILLCAMFLTTTRRSLRDLATRALVLLGERSPKSLFDVTLQHLAFSDPYVTERLLASVYGLLMRNWAFPSRDIEAASPEFARSLYDVMFERGSPYRTKHILTRSYATGSIELIGKMSRNALGRRDRRLLRPPFSNMRLRIPNGDRIREEDVSAADSALHMDFRNYTMGRLVRDRANYDDTHEEYLRLRRQLKWRILQLGYAPERFEKADRSIAGDNSAYGRREDGAKTDRYGKKYSWIAFYELAGSQEDRGLLPDRYDARISDCDIDPSFPSKPPRWRPEIQSPFRRPFRTPKAWLAGPAPSRRSLLHQSVVDDVAGPWVLLDGFVSEHEKDGPRDFFTFMRGMLLKKNQLPLLEKLIAETEHPGNSAIPTGGSDYYVYRGEIPWSRRYAPELRRKDGTAKQCVEEAFSSSESYEVRKRFDRLAEGELFQVVDPSYLRPRFRILLDEEEAVPDEQEEEEQVPPEFVTLSKYRHVPGIRVELPVRSFDWEDYHCTQNQGVQAHFLAPAIAQTLDLAGRDGEVDLFEKSGRQATAYRIFSDEDSVFSSHLLYLRADLLKTYLNKTGQIIAWINWGEKNFKYPYVEQHGEELREAWETHSHIHKEIDSWPS